MPERWLVCHVAMLPRLQAEEALTGVAIATAADSWLERRHRQDIMGGWQRQMDGAAGEPEQISEREFRDRMAMLGLHIEE